MQSLCAYEAALCRYGLFLASKLLVTTNWKAVLKITDSIRSYRKPINCFYYREEIGSVWFEVTLHSDKISFSIRYLPTGYEKQNPTSSCEMRQADDDDKTEKISYQETQYLPK